MCNTRCTEVQFLPHSDQPVNCIDGVSCCFCWVTHNIRVQKSCMGNRGVPKGRGLQGAQIEICKQKVLRDLFPAAGSSYGNRLVTSTIEIWKTKFKTLWCLGWRKERKKEKKRFDPVVWIRWVSHGAWGGYLCVYINAVANSVMLQGYLGHDFTAQFLKSNINYVWLRGQPPPPKWKILGAHLVGKMRMLFLSNSVVKGWRFWVCGGEIVLKL
jgi:hypothetical protein